MSILEKTNKGLHSATVAMKTALPSAGVWSWACSVDFGHPYGGTVLSTWEIKTFLLNSIDFSWELAETT